MFSFSQQENVPFYIAYLNQKADEILAIAKTYPEPVFIAIDGRCASGKTSLASIMEAKGAQVVHMDDYFPRVEQRTRERFEEPGGNLDRERVEEEVLIPLKEGKNGVVHPFDCTRMELSERKWEIEPKGIIVFEGSYSLHPELRKYYDFSVFMDVLPDEQLDRILERNGEVKLEMFKSRWIPFEEKYISAFGVKEYADLYINTSMTDEF